MSKIITLGQDQQKNELFSKVEAMDVRGKILCVYLRGDRLRDYYGDGVWKRIREAGATSVVFIPDHMRLELFTDEDLAGIGLQRIPPADEGTEIHTKLPESIQGVEWKK